MKIRLGVKAYNGIEKATHRDEAKSAVDLCWVEVDGFKITWVTTAKMKVKRGNHIIEVGLIGIPEVVWLDAEGEELPRTEPEATERQEYLVAKRDAARAESIARLDAALESPTDQ